VIAPGVPLTFEHGELMVEARPSEVAADQLALLRTYKADLLPIIAAFGEASVLIRPPTPIPAAPKLGNRVWSEPLRPRRAGACHRAGEHLDRRPKPTADWRRDELERRRIVEAGGTAAAHLYRDPALVGWARGPDLGPSDRTRGGCPAGGTPGPGVMSPLAMAGWAARLPPSTMTRLR
jgi:hypothetical protein